MKIKKAFFEAFLFLGFLCFSFGLLILFIPSMTGCSGNSSIHQGDGGTNVHDDATKNDGAPDDGRVDGGDGGTECIEHEFEDVWVPMSDGKELSAFVRRPANPLCKVPTILIQTPYNKESARTLWFDNDPALNPLFSSTDFAFVVMDWRGFYGSSGAGIAQPDYGLDGYDAVEWIAEQPWSDGQVASWGVSALCRVQYWTAVEQPPHLVTGVPIFCSINNSYEEYYPGGVVRREYVDILAMLFGQSVVENHPYKDFAWTYMETLYEPADVNVPMLVVAGWFDLNPSCSIETYRRLRQSTDSPSADLHRLMIGPWHHFAAGGETAGGRTLTEQELKYYDSAGKIQRDSLAWFQHHLLGQENDVADWEPVRYVMAGMNGEGEGDEDLWLGAETWPPGGVVEHTLYLDDSGLLVEDVPEPASLTFTYDPEDPSPTIGGSTLSFDLLHGPHHQDVVIVRDDALVFTGEVLSQPLPLKGTIRLELDVSTTGADTDFAVRLTDVDPSGNHLLIGEGIRRTKLRDSFSAVSPVIPGERYSLTVHVINDLGYYFREGHRIGVIITSSNYPRFDRNPNTGVDFYHQAPIPVTVDNTVYLGESSRLIFTAE